MKKLITSILMLLSFAALADERYWDNRRLEDQNREMLRNQRNMQMQMEYQQNMQNGYQNRESRREREERAQYERDRASGFHLDD